MKPPPGDFVAAKIAEIDALYRKYGEAMGRFYFGGPDLGRSTFTPRPVPWHRRLRWRIDAAIDRALRWFGLARISRPPPEWDRDE